LVSRPYRQTTSCIDFSPAWFLDHTDRHA